MAGSWSNRVYLRTGEDATVHKDHSTGPHVAIPFGGQPGEMPCDGCGAPPAMDGLPCRICGD